MSAQQLHLFNGLYLVVLVVVAVLSRATARRLAGALAGAAAMEVGLAIVALGERVGWWHWTFPWEPNFLTALGINSALCAFVFLITWRIARRFGGRGLAVVAVVLGPIRDKGFVERFPEWGSFAPGVAPVLATSARDWPTCASARPSTRPSASRVSTVASRAGPGRGRNEWQAKSSNRPTRSRASRPARGWLTPDTSTPPRPTRGRGSADRWKSNLFPARRRPARTPPRRPTRRAATGRLIRGP
jgi:hypothetical protein